MKVQVATARKEVVGVPTIPNTCDVVAIRLPQLVGHLVTHNRVDCAVLQSSAGNYTHLVAGAEVNVPVVLH